MIDYKNMWSSLLRVSFSPPEKRWFLWTAAGPFLQVLSIAILFVQTSSTLQWLFGFSTICSTTIWILCLKEGQKFFQEELKEKKEAESEKKLWQARFQVIQEKMEKERELLEGENEIYTREIEEKKEHIASLRRLAKTMQEQFSCSLKEVVDEGEVEDLKKQLQEALEKVHTQEEVKKKRRERNETLLATSGKGVIALKDLAKGIK